MGISLEKIREAKKAAQDPISLETPIGEKEDSHLGDFIEDQKTASPEDEAAATMRREQVYSMLDTLTEREKGVLALALWHGRRNTKNSGRSRQALRRHS